MGGRRLEQDLRQVRTAYLGTVHTLTATVQEWNRLGVPLRPDRIGHLRAWTEPEIRATVAVATGWRRLVEARREYELLLADYERTL